MRYLTKLMFGLIIVLMLSSCGAIPTLPPLESTVSIWTPDTTNLISESTATPIQVEPTLGPTTQPKKTDQPLITATFTAVPNTATESAKSTEVPSSTPTDMPANTATFTPTYTFTPVPTYTPTPVPYTLQQMNPFYLANFTHPDDGCSWLGVAGQVFNKDGQVQKEIVIRAGGSINGVDVIEDMVMPLTEPEIDLSYGPGGFEITLADQVTETDEEVWIQLYNLTGDPLSERIYLVTYNDCLRNLILMNFSEK